MTEERTDDRELGDLFRALDDPLPEISARDIVRRARRGRVGRLRLAAGIAAALAVAGTAYALPGSPLRAWVERLVAPAAEHDGAGGAARPAGDPGAGLLFDPAEPLTLQVDGGGHLRIRLTTEAELTVRMIAGEARFTSDPGRLEVQLAPSDTLELLVPATARSVEALHGETALFRKRGETVEAAVERDAAGVYSFDLSAGRP
jgi:hypothetical protein